MTGSFDPLFIWIARATLAVLLAHAALSKLADRALFEQHLAAYRVPTGWLAALAMALPLAELAAAALLLSPWRVVGAGLAAGLLALYAGAMARARLQGREPDCGCGGDPLPVSWALVARNGLLLGVAALAGAHADARTPGWPDFLVIVPAVLVGTLLYAALNQVLRHQAGLRRRAPGTTLWRT